MEATEFVYQVSRLTPVREDVPDIILKYFNIKEKEVHNDFVSQPQNEIETLIHKYHCNYIRFGEFEFLDKIVYLDGMKIFASGSHSFLMYSNAYSGDVMEIDSEEGTNNALCNVSSTPNQFLDALLLLYELMSLRVDRKVSKDDVEVNEKFLNDCALKAGGAKYKDFYRSIIR